MNRSGWIMLICAASVLGVAFGFRQALGLFLSPISIDLGIGRASFALSLGLMNLCWGLGAPFAGAVADRYGAGWITVAGGVLYAAGLAVLATSGSEEQVLLSGVLIGFSLSATGFTVVLGTVARSVPDTHRSTALGIASMGGSVGQFVALPYVHLLIGGYGWSTALLLMAASALLIAPLAYGMAGKPVDDGSTQRQGMHEAFTAALRVPSFWLLNLGFLVCGFHLSFVGFHLPSFLSDKGFEPWLATTALTVVGIANVIGSYGCGVLGGHYAKKNILTLLYLARAAAMLLFIVLPITETTVLVFSAVMGLMWLGTVPLTSGLVASIFGTRNMSMLFGIVFLGHQIGGFLGAWLGGVAYDLLQSYDAMWWLSIALALIAAALHWPIEERPIVKTAELVPQ
jgi:predicted MFS family arabinose efflux permease